MKKIILIFMCASIKLLSQCSPGTVTTITASTTLSSTNFSGDVIIKNKAVVYMSGTFKFKEGALLIVQDEAQLYINNATLTAFCPQTTWGGVRVLGELGCSSMPSYLNIKNSTLEFADVGIQNSLPNGKINYCGSVHAENTFFRHNRNQDISLLDERPMRYAVSSGPYGGTYAVREYDIKNCTFFDDVNTLQYIFGSTSRAKNNISLANHHGKSIYGNTFINNTIQSFISYRAITMYNSNNIIIEKNSFQSQSQALRVENSRSIYIRSNHFKDARILSWNIYMSACSQSEIVMNKFTHDGTPFLTPATGGGQSFMHDITYMNCTDVKVQNNYFRFRKAINTTIPINYMGIEMQNNGTINNEVFNNVFDYKIASHIPILVYGNNGINTSPSLSRGTMFTCNQFHWDKLDQNIVLDNSSTTSVAYNQARIAFISGVVVSSASNTFSIMNNNTSGTRKHIINVGTSPTMNYYYDGATGLSNRKFPFYTTPNVAKTFYNTPDGCLINYEIPGWTNIWDSEVNNPTYGEAPPYNPIIDISSIITKRNNVIQAIGTQNTTLNNMIAAGGYSSEDIVSQQTIVAGLKVQRDNYTGMITRDIVKGRTEVCENYNDAELIGLFRSYENFESEFLIADYYLSLKKYDQAISYLNNAENLYNMSASDKTDFQNTAYIYSVLKNLDDTTRTDKHLTPTERNNLESITTQNGRHSSQLACIYLSIENNKICDLHTPHINDTIIYDTTVVMDNYFQLYPNPASTEIHLKYTDMIHLMTDLEIKIYDLSGNELINDIFNATIEEKTIDINSLNNGYYICKIIENGILRSSINFTVNR